MIGFFLHLPESTLAIHGVSGTPESCPELLFGRVQRSCPGAYVSSGISARSKEAVDGTQEARGRVASLESHSALSVQ